MDRGDEKKWLLENKEGNADPIPHVKMQGEDEKPNPLLHELPLEKLYSYFGSSENGHTTESYEKAFLKYGLNKIVMPPSKPIWRIMLDNVFSNFNVICMVIIGLSIIGQVARNEVTADNIQFVVTLSIIIILTSAIQTAVDYSTEQLSEKLNEMGRNDQVIVLRNGIRTSIDGVNLVPGDICELAMSHVAPADIVAIKSVDLKVNTSSITGESKPVKKVPKQEESQDNKGIVFLQSNYCIPSSSTIAQGELLKGLVIKTGNKTEVGSVVDGKKREEQGVETELTKQLNKYFIICVILATLVGLGCILASIAYGTVARTFLLFVALFIAFIPEGIILSLAIARIMVAQKLKGLGVHVKRLIVPEEAANVNYIVVDKTGTLTENIVDLEKVITKDGLEYTERDIEDELLKFLACSSDVPETRDIRTLQTADISKSIGSKNAIEEAIFNFCFKVDENKTRKFVYSSKIVYYRTFNSTNKYSLSIQDLYDQSSNYVKRLLIVKGAPEKIFNLSRNNTENVQKKFIACAEQGKRLVALATLTLDDTVYKPGYDFENHEFDLNTVGKLDFGILIVMTDPLKPESRQMVMRLRSAGIKVVMCTGDGKLPAKFNSKESGIIVSDCKTADELAEEYNLPVTSISSQEAASILLDGSQVGKMSSVELENILNKFVEVSIYRCLPEHKLTVFEALEGKGMMIGDGTNDVKVLMRAAVGITFNKGGTGASKAAANVILTEKAESATPLVVEYGRKTIESITRSIQYLNRSLLHEVIAIILTAFYGYLDVINSSWILIVDILIEILPPITFPFEEEEKDLMLEKQKVLNRRSISSFATFTVNFIIFSSLSTVIIFSSFFIVFKTKNIEFYQLTNLNPLWNDNRMLLMNNHSKKIEIYTFSQRQRMQSIGRLEFIKANVFMQIIHLVLTKTWSKSIFRHDIFKNKLQLISMALFVLFYLSVTIYEILILKFDTLFGYNTMLLILVLNILGSAIVVIFDEIRKLWIRRTNTDAYVPFHAFIYN